MEELLIRFLNHITALQRKLSQRHPDLCAGEIQVGLAVRPGTDKATGPVALDRSAQDRHLYLLGASGSGKSRLLELLVRQLIRRGEGFCLVDPHGDLTTNILTYLYDRKHRHSSGLAVDDSRVHLIEPFREEAVVGLNALDPGGAPLHPHIGQLVSILRRFWSGSWGPRMEELLRTGLLTLASCKPPLTLVELVPLLVDAEFRARVLTTVDDDAVRAYWHCRYDPLSGGGRLAMSEPVLNKVGALLADPRVRGMLGRRETGLDLRRLMDAGGWVLFNCSRGQLRDASYLLGSFLVAQIQAAALSRAAVSEADRRPFTLLVDEFQHFRADDFTEILCEARKYRLRLVMAHQNLSQLEAPLQQAIFSNAGTHIIFAVSAQDAAAVIKQSPEGVIGVEQLIHQPVGHAFFFRRGHLPVRTRIFPVEIPAIAPAELAVYARELATRHGVPLKEVEVEIRQRAGGAAPGPDPVPAAPSPPPPKGKRRRKEAAGAPPQPTPSSPAAGSEGSAPIKEAPDD